MVIAAEAINCFLLILMVFGFPVEPEVCRFNSFWFDWKNATISTTWGNCSRMVRGHGLPLAGCQLSCCSCNTNCEWTILYQGKYKAGKNTSFFPAYSCFNSLSLWKLWKLLEVRISFFKKCSFSFLRLLHQVIH